MVIFPEDIVKLLLSLALGGIIGAERELRDKAAGFRTLMFICVGSTLFTIFSVRVAVASGADPGRIAAQIVTGIGFLGGGVILRERGEVRGLTTASTIWLVAALGVGVGSGEFLFSTLAAGVILLALLVFPGAERLMGSFSQVRIYTIRTAADAEKKVALEAVVHKHNLRILTTRRSRLKDQMTITWTMIGRPKNHEAFEAELFADPEIEAFEV